MVHNPKFDELLTYVVSAFRNVNERPLGFYCYHSSFTFTPFLDPHVAVEQPHDRDMLRRDYRLNLSFSLQFWEKWIAFYLPWLQGRKKWLKVSKNLKPGGYEQLVAMSSLENISQRGKYKLGRIEKVISQISNGKPKVRQAKVAVTKVDETKGEVKIEYMLRNVSRLDPVDNAQPVAHLRRTRSTAVACFPLNIEMCIKLIASQLCVLIIIIFLLFFFVFILY